MEQSIGRIMLVSYDSETKDMIITIKITDDKYKRQILRDFKGSEKLLIKGQEVMVVIDRPCEERK